MAFAFFLEKILSLGILRSKQLWLGQVLKQEYRALASAATDLIWIQHLLTEIGINLILWCDNQGAQGLASNPVYHARTKYIEIDVHFVRDLVTSNKLEVRYITTEFQPADLLTKALSEDRFQTLRCKLTMEGSMSSLRGAIEEEGSGSHIE